RRTTRGSPWPRLRRRRRCVRSEKYSLAQMQTDALDAIVREIHRFVRKRSQHLRREHDQKEPGGVHSGRSEQTPCTWPAFLRDTAEKLRLIENRGFGSKPYAYPDLHRYIPYLAMGRRT